VSKYNKPTKAGWVTLLGFTWQHRHVLTDPQVVLFEAITRMGEKKARIVEMRGFNARRVFGGTDISRMSASD
jgi:hypothetical protein